MRNLIVIVAAFVVLVAVHAEDHEAQDQTGNDDDFQVIGE